MLKKASSAQPMLLLPPNDQPARKCAETSSQEIQTGRKCCCGGIEFPDGVLVTIDDAVMLLASSPSSVTCMSWKSVS